MGCAELVGKPSSQVNVTRRGALRFYDPPQGALNLFLAIYQNLMAQIPLSCWVVAVG